MGAEVVPVAAAAMAAVEEVQDPDEDPRAGLLRLEEEEGVALEGGTMILAVAMVAAGEQAEGEEVEVPDGAPAEAILVATGTVTDLFPRKPGGCSSSPTSPSNT